MHILYLSWTGDRAVNEPILSALKSLKFAYFDGSFSPEDADKGGKLSKAVREVKKTDGVVVEATHANFDMGRMMTLAIFQHKPILLLQQKGAGSDIELGANRLVNTKSYQAEKPAELERKLEDFVKGMKRQKLTYRFNLMLSRDINGYLLEQSAEKGISKADYIRSLIVQDMGV